MLRGVAALELKTRVAAGYSQTALEYDAVAGHAYLMGLRRLLPLVRVPPQPAILDVGSGTGINLLELARVFGPCRLLVGIDLSPGMVAVAGAKAGMAGVVAVLQEGDAEDIPYPDGTFDLVVANSMYHWVRDRPRAAREFARVLRAGGQLVLACATAPGFGEWRALLQSVLTHLLGPHAPEAFPDLPSAQEVACSLQAAGFALPFFRPIAERVYVYDPERFVRLMATVAPNWAAGLSPETRRAVEAEAARAMRRAAPEGFTVTWTAVETVGTKVAG
ncbi:hypothetical protein caldi_02520 [Caldinitratiruptor microaerophilus]|uniref:Methyltransferase type 11 domain-containing protein n=1 Tax=Caldinitratiruptor microaerophilus TaxID=671077 RepID=A0AA35CHU3_9FIRM|nr:hypothetical protein caldi_02520 [Caldinitratiruptor microaerophilus]